MSKSRMKVLHVGGGIATEMMAMRVSRRLNGVGMTDRRSCHHLGGFFVESRLAPLIRRRAAASSLVNPAYDVLKLCKTWCGAIEAYA
jgi:hypothetical protein